MWLSYKWISFRTLFPHVLKYEGALQDSWMNRHWWCGGAGCWGRPRADSSVQAIAHKGSVNRIGDKVGPPYSHNPGLFKCVTLGTCFNLFLWFGMILTQHILKCSKWYARVGAQATTAWYAGVQFMFQKKKLSYNTPLLWICWLSVAERTELLSKGFSSHLKIYFFSAESALQIFNWIWLLPALILCHLKLCFDIWRSHCLFCNHR